MSGICETVLQIRNIAIPNIKHIEVTSAYVPSEDSHSSLKLALFPSGSRLTLILLILWSKAMKIWKKNIQYPVLEFFMSWHQKLSVKSMSFRIWQIWVLILPLPLSNSGTSGKLHKLIEIEISHLWNERTIPALMSISNIHQLRDFSRNI